MTRDACGRNSRDVARHNGDQGVIDPSFLRASRTAPPVWSWRGAGVTVCRLGRLGSPKVTRESPSPQQSCTFFGVWIIYSGHIIRPIT